MTTTPLERLQSGYYNSNPVSLANPGGMADGGHVTNFPAALADFGNVATSDVVALLANVTGRASIYGFNEIVAAQLFVSTTLEAAFAEAVYRQRFNLTTALATLPAWAFTRTGAGYAETTGGYLLAFATGVPRITDRGLLVEAARTNLIRYSQDIDNAAWSKTGNTVVTANVALSPDGAVSMDRVQFTGGTSYLQQAIVGGGTLTVGQSITLSFYARGGGTIGLRSGVTGQGATRVIGGIAQRFTWTFTAGAASEIVQITNNGIGGSVAGATANADFYLYGVQIEVGGQTSSYIATTSAAATRDSDTTTMTVASAQAGGVFVDVDLPAHAEAQALFSWSNASGMHLQLHRDTAGTMIVNLVKPDGNVAFFRAGYAGARRLRAFLGWGDGQLVLTIDGVEIPGVANSMPVSLTTLRLGRSYTGGSHLDGYIRRLVVCDRLPTASQRVSMTTA